jgi:hypothetical protein
MENRMSNIGQFISGGTDITRAPNLNPTLTGLKEVRVTLGAGAGSTNMNVDTTAGNVFTKTISGTSTFTVSNVAAAGTAVSFLLDITNGGSAVITWFTGIKWGGGSAPVLTTSGRDLLGFITHDGVTWSGVIISKALA